MKKYLQFIAFFSGFTDQELEDFSIASDVIRTRKNEFIIREDEDGKGLFFIVDGEFLVLKEIEEKKYKRLRRLNKGEFFGEMSLLTKENNSASVVSSGEGLLIFLSKKAFENIESNNRNLPYAIMKKLAVILSERLQYMNRKYGMAVGQLQSE